MSGLFDSWERQINYLRVSVTDHCNLNCSYCALDSVTRLPRDEILSYEEILRLIQVAASLGITKIRLTGGEPLMKPDLTNLVRMISRIPEIDDLSLTTNGVLLSKYADELKEAGLKRVNVSLDTLKEERFRQITGRAELGKVLAGIAAAEKAGLTPVKINMVVLKGINDDEVLDFARKTVEDGWNVRFIEFMPFGTDNAGDLHTVPTGEIWKQIQALGIPKPHAGQPGNGPARYYRLPEAKGTIGFISPMTEHFCESCNRLRLTADGQMRPCLLDDDEINVKEPLRNGASLDELKKIIRQAVDSKRERHHLAEGLGPEKRAMFQIGG